LLFYYHKKFVCGIKYIKRLITMGGLCEFLLMAVVVLLVILITRCMSEPRPEGVKSKPVAPPAPVRQVQAPRQAAPQTYEGMAQQALRDNTEYFTACATPSEQLTSCNPVCGSEDANNFAKFEYGSPNASYQDFVASQAVDDKVIQNHLQFVRDRKGLGNDEFTTGRTYTPDSHDSYDPVPWSGIRGRPQGIPGGPCNPSQIPDLDTNLFKGNKKFCFWT
jgi:hypothetical protein